MRSFREQDELQDAVRIATGKFNPDYEQHTGEKLGIEPGWRIGSVVIHAGIVFQVKARQDLAQRQAKANEQYYY